MNRDEKNFENEKFEDLLRYSSGLAAEELIKQYDNDEEVEFSESYKKRKEELLKKAKRDDQRKKFISYSKRAAVFLIAAIIVSVSTVLGVDAWRIRFFNLFTENSETNTEIRYEDTENSSVQIYDDILFGYVPNEFNLVQEKITKNSTLLRFEKNSHFFRLRVLKNTGIQNVDTEKGDYKSIKINGTDAFLTYKNNEITINWAENNSEYSYSLLGNLTEETMIKIAENIRKK